MTFTETPLPGAYIIEPDQFRDERGFFARSWCRDELARQGLDPSVAQMNISYNFRRGTLRGMHFQQSPHEEVKIVRCTRGRVFDVLLDLRPESPTYLKWFGVELSADNYRMLYIPKRFGHGYQTLEDHSDIFYLVSAFYAPAHASGVLYNDPAFGIHWPLEVSEISEKDRSWPAFDGRPIFPEPGVKP